MFFFMSFNIAQRSFSCRLMRAKKICGRSSLLTSQPLPQHAHHKFEDFVHVDMNYRVAHLVADVGWVDLDFECSTVWPILPGLMGIRQKGLGKWVRLWNTEIQVSPTQVRDQMGHPARHWGQGKPIRRRGVVPVYNRVCTSVNAIHVRPKVHWKWQGFRWNCVGGNWPQTHSFSRNSIFHIEQIVCNCLLWPKTTSHTID